MLQTKLGHLIQSKAMIQIPEKVGDSEDAGLIQRNSAMYIYYHILSNEN